MNAFVFAFTCFTSPGLHPNLDDLRYFPDWWTAHRQIEMCREHLWRLEALRCHHAYDAPYREWIAQTQWMMRYWELLKLAQDSDLYSEDFRYDRLLELWDHIGIACYKNAYRPPLLREDLQPKPPVRVGRRNGA